MTLQELFYTGQQMEDMRKKYLKRPGIKHWRGN